MSNVVVLGGGYGGLTVVNELLENIPADARVFLVDRMPFGGLKTEFYALAAGTVSELDIRVSFPSHPQLEVVYGEVTDVSFEEKSVRFANRDPLSYDSLVIALGCTDNFHGIPGAYENSTGVQTMAAARRTYHLLGNTKPYGQVTIVGGGLSGVEVASELRESRPDLNIRILDRSSLMSAFPGKLQHFAKSWFSEHHVELRSQIHIVRLEPGVIYNDNEEILSDVTVWTAGIQPVELVQRMNYPKDKQGRLIVNDYHELPDVPNVFVIGDCSSQPFSPSGQLAQAQGHQVAQVISARWNNKEPRVSRIRLKGTLGSLGKKSGFGLMGSTPVYGRLARLLKSGVLWKSRRHFG
ncbi:NADH dehydrogenase-like protein YutJ [Cohnella xylanilytica]|uniref:FAD-dependent oxidoreductase n=1 Tax=Cohnella xylanilytica TaxID=557555 RepID=A0A841U221_9BACL|nr:FAD-dependent oxidoreductase [Cohnella xylanilytica]MBB6691994.1 FAD-dependent oxidoreductase [Cohnella xylanilytica]GIO11137.1 NADH dehydrogenase-like protein YutJ [Cohnella xylanilytica]